MPVDVQDFEIDVIERSRKRPVLVDFWAAWCAPCRMLGPVLEKLEGQSGGTWELAKVDTELFGDVAVTYGIQSIPAVKLFVDGVVRAEFTGALPEYAVTRWLREHLPAKHSASIGRAQELIRNERIEEARQLLDEVVRDDPESGEARAMLARLIVFDDPSGARALLSTVDDPKQDELVQSVRTLADGLGMAGDPSQLPEASVKEEYLRGLVAVRQQQFDRALECFIDVIRTERYYNDDGARKMCIAIFKFLGEDHPVTGHYRRDFSGALYV